MRHIISVLLENEPGALARVANLFTARGYNIESLSVAATEDRSMSRMTLVTNGDDAIVEQIVKQLNKLVDVIKLIEVTDSPYMERELMLIKVKAASPTAREEVRQVAETFRGRIVDTTPSTLVIEVVGGGQKLSALVGALDPGGVLEVVRTGPCAMSRGTKSLRA